MIFFIKHEKKRITCCFSQKRQCSHIAAALHVLRDGMRYYRQRQIDMNEISFTWWYTAAQPALGRLIKEGH